MLSLYDGGRLQNFAIKSGMAIKRLKCLLLTSEIRSKLAATTGRIAIVSPTIISPSTKRAIAEFAARYPNTTHVMYDAQSAVGSAAGQQRSGSWLMISAAQTSS